MKLYYTPNSPYARKVLICAIEKGVYDQIELINSPPRDNAPDLQAANPLGKVPALVLSNGEAIYDSPVICEYIDGLSDQNMLFPSNHAARIEARKIEALADGIMDAFVARYLEGLRPEGERSPSWTKRWEDAISRALDVLEQGREKLPEGVNIGSIALCAAVSPIKYVYMKDFKKKYPKLAAWMDIFEKRDSVQKTLPKK